MPRATAPRRALPGLAQAHKPETSWRRHQRFRRDRSRHGHSALLSCDLRLLTLTTAPRPSEREELFLTFGKLAHTSQAHGPRPFYVTTRRFFGHGEALVCSIARTDYRRGLPSKNLPTTRLSAAILFHMARRLCRSTPSCEEAPLLKILSQPVPCLPASRPFFRHSQLGPSEPARRRARRRHGPPIRSTRCQPQAGPRQQHLQGCMTATSRLDAFN